MWRLEVVTKLTPAQLREVVVIIGYEALGSRLSRRQRNADEHVRCTDTVDPVGMSFCPRRNQPWIMAFDEKRLHAAAAAGEENASRQSCSRVQKIFTVD